MKMIVVLMLLVVNMFTSASTYAADTMMMNSTIKTQGVMVGGVANTMNSKNHTTVVACDLWWVIHIIDTVLVPAE